MYVFALVSPLFARIAALVHLRPESRLTARAVAGSLGLAVAVISLPGATSEEADAAALVERGKYLTIAGNCASCHTASQGVFMAGGVRFATPFGDIYSTNITPDVDTGLGGWSEDDFLLSMRKGLRPNGEHLYPVFPYTAFTKLADEDVGAIFAYLRSIPAVRQTPPQNELAFPFGIRALMAGWKALFFEPGAFEYDPKASAQWNRGAYLVEALGHCSACHSPRNALGAEQSAHAMRGGEYIDEVPEHGYRAWSAPNLTASQRGLGLWSEAELAAYLKTSRNGFLESFGPMNEVIVNSTSLLTDADVAAMANYLKSLPASEEADTAPPSQAVMGRGRTVYNLHCGTCHLPTGEGDPEMAPRLNRGSLVVQAANPASMINAILYSPEAPALSLPQKWRKPMAEFQYLLDDDEVAAVVSFIRSSWDNSAGAVTPEQVAEQR